MYTNRINGELEIYGHKSPIKGTIIEMERTYGLHPETKLIVVEDNSAVEMINCRCSMEPFTNKKEEDNMSVKIKKQPREITLEELKQADEFEKLIIHIDNDKKEAIEEKYGLKYGMSNRVYFRNGELEFKENYLRSDDDDIVPYEFITKIEVVDL